MAMNRVQYHGAHVKAPVEQVLNLSEVTVGVLLKAERVVSAGQGSFEVAQDRVDDQERGVLGARSAAAGDVLFMQAGCPCPGRR